MIGCMCEFHIGDGTSIETRMDFHSRPILGDVVSVGFTCAAPTGEWTVVRVGHWAPPRGSEVLLSAVLVKIPVIVNDDE